MQYGLQSVHVRYHATGLTACADAALLMLLALPLPPQPLGSTDSNCMSAL
jgi:hypothetical protein